MKKAGYHKSQRKAGRQCSLQLHPEQFLSTRLCHLFLPSIIRLKYFSFPHRQHALALRHIMIQVHRDLENLPKFKNAVITIGTFDGVHLGHQQIIKQLKEEAAQIDGETVIITFHPHPRKVVSEGKREIKILTTLDEKIELLNEKGVNHLVVVPFNSSFSNQTAEEYIEKFLVKKFQPHTIIIGYDHKFGKNRSGDYHLLENLGERFNYRVKEIPEHVLNEVTISSTRVREALLRSDIETANNCLGYSYFFTG